MIGDRIGVSSSAVEPELGTFVHLRDSVRRGRPRRVIGRRGRHCAVVGCQQREGVQRLLDDGDVRVVEATLGRDAQRPLVTSGGRGRRGRI